MSTDQQSQPDERDDKAEEFFKALARASFMFCHICKVRTSWIYVRDGYDSLWRGEWLTARCQSCQTEGPWLYSTFERYEL